MTRTFVGSREYKVMLQASRFKGDAAAVLQAARSFWRDGVAAFGPAVLAAEGDLAAVEAERLIRFYDTATRRLNRASYILRERVAPDGVDREVTLKFRHPDRYLAADRDMDARKGAKAKTKFEEDIKPPFENLYSFSTTQAVEPKLKLQELGDVVSLFPGLGDALKSFSPAEPIAVVDGFTAHEQVIGGARLQLGKTHKLAAKCALVVWRDHRVPGSDPVVAEFSFKYGDLGEAYGGGAVRRAYEAFQLLQTKLPEWFDPDSKTKTAFVYR